ncbi:MAG: Phosphoenolpyruvate-protein phosphotransferase [Lentisphaerae bacterium ADurb.BinA184]|nr:MAG: Phosphoenolpyruvate-protein phosphotransferase [Lentisphaerae bacterium ADurb.BinA184]
MPSKPCSKTALAKAEGRARRGAALSGIGVSAGIVIARALVVGSRRGPVQEVPLAAADVDKEIRRFKAVLQASVEQLEGLRRRVAGILGEKDARIFDAHQAMVADQGLIDEVISRIREKRRNAEFVFAQVIQHYADALSKVDDPFIRDRLADIRDVAGRVIGNLLGEKAVDLACLPRRSILVAHDLSPSDTAALDRGNVLGFATAIGSRTSHTAIMARSMGIPAVVGLAAVLDQVHTGDLLIMDGVHGKVLVNPDAATVGDYRRRIRSQERWLRRIEQDAELPAETLDGFRVQLAANIALPAEVEEIRTSYGVGIGLFRTEYLFINRTSLPTEDEQFEAYRKVAEEIYPHSVIIRTLDVGGDKFLSNLRMPGDLNPFLGVRAIRFCLARPDIFLAQLRAILRASSYGKVRIMFPMIATFEELQKAAARLAQARAELDARHVHYNPNMDIGIMVEVPSAALLADRLARHVDFFSLGTNDLVQYSLACDRANPNISYLYQPSHPSIIRMIQMVVQSAYEHGKWVSVCGEMAGEPVLVPLVLGVGIHELSMSPVSLGPIKRLIRSMRLHEAEGLVDRALACSTGQEVRALCERYVGRVAPELLTN